MLKLLELNILKLLYSVFDNVKTTVTLNFLV